MHNDRPQTDFRAPLLTYRTCSRDSLTYPECMKQYGGQS